MIWLSVLLLLIALAAGWLSQLVGLPGNWLIVAAVACYVWAVGPDSAAAIGWSTVVALVALAVVGEVIELLAGTLGVSKAGGSRRGALLALVGSLVGGMAGMLVGLPIPVIGSLAASVLLAAAGAFVGAFLGERWLGRRFDDSVQVGQAAFVGRLLGTLGKIIAGAAMVAVTLAALIF